MNEAQPLDDTAKSAGADVSAPLPAVAPPELERYPFWGYSDLLLFAGLAIPCLLLGAGLVKGVILLTHIHARVAAAELIVEQFAGYGFLFAALWLIFRVEYGRPFWRSLGWVDTRLPLIWMVIAGGATAFVVAVVGALIGTPTVSNPMTELMKGRTAVILVAVFGTTLGPLCEELAFRGLMQPLLVRTLGAFPGILAAAIPFGMLHYQEYGNSWRHAVLISGAGSAFGLVRHVTGSTKASTIMHASYNALVAAALIQGAS